MTGGAESGEPPLRISVVVPSWRDSNNLSVLLPGLAKLASVTETIVIDASDDARSERIAQECRAMFVKSAAPNRGAQMNAGAALACGDVIVFQHADTELTDAHLRALTHALRDPEVIGGAFHRKFDERHPRLRWLERAARSLARNGGTLYGDQSIFVRREAFLRLRGFAQIPLMEDMEFSRRLRAAGKTVVLDPAIRSSARRHQREGAWKTSVQNGLFILLYHCGVSPMTLHQWYYKQKRSVPENARERTEPELSL
ncbi:MAG: TIGR04283 family arsenosugar biosynthesis glycosyltransferase [Chthoniobacterales bacterium]|nr:TIGR04283 family arsenosugar biosynthesis glycosyltransferase [Chthoniobacterales bacterium]